MASRGAELPPWDRRNKRQEKLMDTSPYKKILNNARINLRNNLRLDDIWAHLHHLTVITQNDEDRMKLNATNCDSVDRLIAFLYTCETWSYHALLRAMALTQQGHLIPTDGLPKAVYMEGIDLATDPATRKQHFHQVADTKDKIAISADLLPAILRHCEVLEEILLKAPLFGFHDDITIDIAQLHIETDVTCIENKEIHTVGWRQLFSTLFQRHAPKTILIEGEAGSGKTTFLEDYVSRHSKELIECEKKGPDSPCEGHRWKLIIYIPAGSIVGSQEDAIHENLYCDGKHKDQMMTMIKDDGDGVLIINDALDELHKEAEKKSIRQYTISHQKGGRPKVLNSARHGLCPIEGRYIDRKVTLHGFSPDQGLEYVNKYFKKVPQSTTENPPLLDYIKQQKKELEWILTNPFRTHVFSHLAASGMLKPEDIRSLSTPKLLKVLEAFALKRDVKRRDADTAEDHSSDLYTICLKSLLKEDRTIAQQHIPDKSPYKAFLVKQKEINLYAEEESFFRFGHEIYFEYFAVRGLCQYLKSNPSYSKAMILGLCGNPNMRNTLRLFCGYVSEFEPELQHHLSFLIRACIILQTEKFDTDPDEANEVEHRGGEKMQDTKGEEVERGNADSGPDPQDDQGHGAEDKEGTTEECPEANNEYQRQSRMKEVIKRLLELPALVKENFSPNILSTGLNEEKMAILLDVADQIEAAFNEKAKYLKAAGWFLHAGYKQHSMYIEQTELLRFITGCSRQCSPSLQEKISNHSTHALLPTTRYKMKDDQGKQYDEYVFPVPGLRWGVVHAFHDSTNISFWCPSDIVPMLRQLYKVRPKPTESHCVCLDLGYSSSLWGLQTSGVLTNGEWLSALREIFANRVNRIIVYTDHVSGTTPLSGLLSGMKQVIKAQHGLSAVSIDRGEISAPEMGGFADWSTRVHLTVRMWYTTVVLSEGMADSVARSLDNFVCDVMQQSFCATYKSHDGREVHPY